MATTPQIVNPTLTDAGLAAANKADKSGIQLFITHVALGSGRYSSSQLGASMTSLSAMKEFVAIGQGRASGSSGFTCTVEFPSWIGATYEASEIGFYAGSPNNGGTLVAVYSSAETPLVQRNALRYVSTFIFQQSRLPAGVINVKADVDAVVYGELLSIHEGRSDPHSQYLMKKGGEVTGSLTGVTASRLENSKKFATTEFVQMQGNSFPTSGAILSGTATLGSSAVGNLVSVSAAGATITLPKAGDMPAGATITIRCPVANAFVKGQGTDTITPIASLDGSVLSVYGMSKGKSAVFVRNATGAWLVATESSSEPAGKLAYFAGFKLPDGWVSPMGQLLNRGVYANLFAFAQYQGLVTEAQWSNGGYSGRFSLGTDSSNFRLPDLRGVFLRSLDGNRSVDPGRTWGSYQDSSNRSHKHAVTDHGHTHEVTMLPAGDHDHSSISPWHNVMVKPRVADYMRYDIHLDQAWSVEEGRGRPDVPLKDLTADGQHTHPIVVGGATSSIQINNEGGAEARPVNTALVLGLKF